MSLPSIPTEAKEVSPLLLMEKWITATSLVLKSLMRKNSLMKISLKMNSNRTEKELNNHSTFIHPLQADSILSSSLKRILQTCQLLPHGLKIHDRGQARNPNQNHKIFFHAMMAWMSSLEEQTSTEMVCSTVMNSVGQMPLKK